MYMWYIIISIIYYIYYVHMYINVHIGSRMSYIRIDTYVWTIAIVW